VRADYVTRPMGIHGYIRDNCVAYVMIGCYNANMRVGYGI